MHKFFYLVSFIILVLNFTAKADFEFEFDGRSYKIVESLLTWEDASLAAVDAGGYLVQINSEEEQNAVYNAILESEIQDNYTTVMDGGGIAYIWIGATDKAEEGVWLWDGNDDDDGEIFWKGQGENGNNDGESQNDSYQNWGGKTQYGYAKEPDDFQNAQDAAAIALDEWPKNMGFLGKASEWNDININNELYFIIEYDNNTKVNDKGSMNELFIFPNPVIDKLNISNQKQMTITSFEISDLKGNILQTEIINGNTKNYQIDISEFSFGTYILLINMDNQVYSQKFIISN